MRRYLAQLRRSQVDPACLVACFGHIHRLPLEAGIGWHLIAIGNDGQREGVE